jgi:hypothetical protein
VLLTSLWSSQVPQASSSFSTPLLKAAVKQSRVHLLDTRTGKTYNIPEAEVAQVVEQRTENPRVSGSTPLLGTNYEVVEQNQVSTRISPCKGDVTENVLRGLRFLG